MEEAKLRQIEAKLFQLLAQFDPPGRQKTTVSPKSGGAIVIRRRKGKPDVHISRETADLC